jgi:hypothetical protein
VLLAALRDDRRGPRAGRSRLCVLVLLLIAAIFNRVHGEGINTKGDRVISGLLALPLITLWVKLVFPTQISYGHW